MGSILSSCCDKTQVQPKSLLQEAYLIKLSTDYSYFFNQDWFGVEKHLFDPEKFIFLYPGFKQDQETMEKHWVNADLSNLRHGELVRSKNSVLNKKWQYLIRKGVPARLSRTIILDIFRLTFVDCEQEYISALKIVFKNKPVPTTFKHVPLFGCQTQDDDEEEFDYLNECEKKIQLISKVQILNKTGLEALIRLLWVINNLHHQLEYNPMLLHIIIMLLIYLSEAQAYCVLQFMIKDSQGSLASKEERSTLRWHLIMNEDQFKEVALSCFETVSNRSTTFSQVYERMKKINFNYIELFQEISISLMLTYLPFSVALKVFISYLNEGIKIYFRVIYAVLRHCKAEVLAVQVNSLVKSAIRKKMLNCKSEDYNQLIKQAYKLRLNYAKNVDKQKVKIYLLLSGPQPAFRFDFKLRSIVTLLASPQFEILWDWIPSIYKLSDPMLYFSTKQDGYSLKQLYQKSQFHQGNPVLLLLQAQEGIFGFFCDQMLGVMNKYVGGGETFVFTLQPKVKRFETSGENEEHVYCAPEYISIGNGRWGAAIQLDSELCKGETHQCDTYNNPPFCFEQRFKCIALEVYYLN